MASLQLCGPTPSSHAGRGRHSAFTLIELLVVLGIIAVLIGILLPALSRARDAAKATHCLFNLQQIGVYLQQYQNQYDGRVPIYITAAHMDRIVYHGGVNDYSNLGLLVPAHIAPPSGSDAARVFYCPSLTTAGGARQFNHVELGNPARSNPWIGWSGYSTRITYSLRMEYAAWDGGGAKIQYPNQRWDMDRSTSTTFYLHFSGPRPVFPRASEFNNRGASALVTDLTDIKTINARLTHRGGLNVLYANWSAKLVPMAYVERHLQNIEAVKATNLAGGAPSLRAYFDLWQELDRF